MKVRKVEKELGKQVKYLISLTHKMPFFQKFRIANKILWRG